MSYTSAADRCMLEILVSWYIAVVVYHYCTPMQHNIVSALKSNYYVLPIDSYTSDTNEQVTTQELG